MDSSGNGNVVTSDLKTTTIAESTTKFHPEYERDSLDKPQLSKTLTKDMKKLGISALVIAIIAGGMFWFFQPNQQLKRKSQRVLDSFTVEAGDGVAGAASTAIFADSLFAPTVTVEIDPSLSALRIALGRFKQTSLNRDTITSGVQSVHRYAKVLTHDPSEFKVIEVSDSTYTVTFRDKIKIETKKSSIKVNVDIKIIYTFTKTEGALKISKIQLLKP